MMLFVLIALAGIVAQWLLPWWSMPAVAFLLSFLLAQGSRHALFSGALASAAVWIFYPLFTSISDGNLMTMRVTELFSLPHSSLMYVVSGLVAAIVGGLAAFSGYALKKALHQSPRSD